MQPFWLFPSVLLLGDEPLIGAEAVHRVLKGWVSNPNQQSVSNNALAACKSAVPNPSLNQA
jgi:hypothetical protein